MTILDIDGVSVELVRKRVKNLSLRVLPPDGRVVATIPLRNSMNSATDFIRSKKSWILKQKKRIEERVYDHPKKYVNNEEHYLFGKAYRLILKGTNGKEGVILDNDTIVMIVRDLNNTASKEKILDRWYKKNLEENIPGLISKWESIINVKVKEFRIRKMKTRWGTCNPRAGRIWFSLMLAKRSQILIEYIVVHEMIHFLEQSHNHRFYKYMDSYLPGWKDLRKELR